MTLDQKRKQLELQRVTLGKQELEFKIEEMKEEIKRLESHIEIQNQTINKITLEIKE